MLLSELWGRPWKHARPPMAPLQARRGSLHQQNTTKLILPTCSASAGASQNASARTQSLKHRKHGEAASAVLDVVTDPTAARVPEVLSSAVPPARPPSFKGLNPAVKTGSTTTKKKAGRVRERKNKEGTTKRRINEPRINGQNQSSSALQVDCSHTKVRLFKCHF